MDIVRWPLLCCLDAAHSDRRSCLALHNTPCLHITTPPDPIVIVCLFLPFMRVFFFPSLTSVFFLVFLVFCLFYFSFSQPWKMVPSGTALSYVFPRMSRGSSARLQRNLFSFSVVCVGWLVRKSLSAVVPGKLRRCLFPWFGNSLRASESEACSGACNKLTVCLSVCH